MRFCIIFLFTVFSLPKGFAYNVGDFFSANTSEGIEMSFKVISNSPKECQVVSKTWASPAISKYTTGSVTIPSSVNDYTVVSIGQWAFDECRVTKITIPNSVKIIEKFVMNECRIVSLEIPASVSQIDEEAFYGCSDLSTIKVNEGNKVYDSRDNCNAIILSSANSLFRGCKNTVIPNSVTSINDWAFSMCKSLKNIDIPASVITISSNAFYGCSGLQQVVLPSSLESIGDDAFNRCSSLKSITIPSSVSYIGGGYLFWGCTSLTSLIVAQDNPIYDSRNNCNAIIRTSNNELVAGCKNTTIPNTILKIGDHSLSGRGISSIDIPSSVTTIGRYSFSGNDNLTSIVFPEGVKYINEGAFYNCESLESVTLSKTIVEIGSGAFVWVKKLSSIYSYIESPFIINSAVFYKSSITSDNPFDHCVLYIPKDTKTKYQSTPCWNNFKTIQEMENTPIFYTQDDVTYRIRKDNKTALVKTIAADRVDLVIPNSISYDGTSYTVTALGDSVFHNERDNNYLYSVTFPSTITEVAEKAFWWYGPSAIVWNSDTKLPEKSFDNWRYKSKNFILYVNNSNIAPSGVQNLVINGIADEIILKDGYVFNSPQEFTANIISYTHNYMMETGVSECAGWETIALPFEVQTIYHETKGELVPFAIWNNNSAKKPFWLYQLGSNGFVKASAIKANTPYIISMPNNSKYSSEYTVSGKVTFSSRNVTVKRTAFSYLNSSTYDGATFYPCFSAYNQSAMNYALNVTNDYFTYNGTEKPGSTFICDYRQIYPFEGRFYKSSANTRSLSIAFAEEHATSIEKLLFNNTNGGKYNIYDVKGVLVRSVEEESFEEAIRELVPGLYIVNGKKVIVR